MLRGWARSAAQRLKAQSETLQAKAEELQNALENVKTLEGLIPICMHCGQIRDDQQSWQKMERYIEQRSTAHFCHGLCPKCLDRHYPDPDVK